MPLTIVSVVPEAETALVTLRVPVAALHQSNHDLLRAYLLRGLLIDRDAAEVERRLKVLITPAQAAWLVQRILGAPVTATTVARLKALFTAAERIWLKARITEAQV